MGGREKVGCGGGGWGGGRGGGGGGGGGGCIFILQCGRYQSASWRRRLASAHRRRQARPRNIQDIFHRPGATGRWPKGDTTAAADTARRCASVHGIHHNLFTHSLWHTRQAPSEKWRRCLSVLRTTPRKDHGRCCRPAARSYCPACACLAEMKKKVGYRAARGATEAVHRRPDASPEEA